MDHQAARQHSVGVISPSDCPRAEPSAGRHALEEMRRPAISEGGIVPVGRPTLANVRKHLHLRLCNPRWLRTQRLERAVTADR